ncbi:aspartate/glutamate racemase family protein [Enterococcus faecalis]|uniref:aspartate/glutamate racemase family protein n=1 Tax=Enterococcus faecalis TaxID=1351 RepID=UPI003D6C37A0
MKRIGLIGGMSWESTLPYYRIINSVIMEKKGELYSADCILYSVNFQEIESTISKNDWDTSDRILSNAAQKLELCGVDFLAICSNTMHKCIPAIKENVNLPILHIVDSTSNVMKKRGITSALLIGTRFTMEEDFNKDLFEKDGIEIKTPNYEDRNIIHQIIFDELCRGIINIKSKNIYKNIIMKYCGKDDGVILGCTEIGLLIGQKDLEVPVFDTTKIHAEAIAKESLK